MVGEHRPDAIVKRVARGEHADLAPARRQHLVDALRERARPAPPAPFDQRRDKLEMALAAEHDIGIGDQGAG